MRHDTAILLGLILSGGSGRALLALFYGDPGGGSLVLQLLLAAFFGLIFYVRFYLRKLRDTVSLRGGGKKQEPAAAPTPRAAAGAAAERFERASAGKR